MSVDLIGWCPVLLACMFCISLFSVLNIYSKITNMICERISIGVNIASVTVLLLKP